MVLFDYDTASDPNNIEMAEPETPTLVVSPEWEEVLERLSQDCFRDPP